MSRTILTATVLFVASAANAGEFSRYAAVHTPSGLTWQQAREAAAFAIQPERYDGSTNEGYGPGHLATFDSLAEVDSVWWIGVTNPSQGLPWIGITDELVEGEWRWIDDTPGIWQQSDVFPNPIRTTGANFPLNMRSIQGYDYAYIYCPTDPLDQYLRPTHPSFSSYPGTAHSQWSMVEWEPLATVPEPSTFVLGLFALVGMIILARTIGQRSG